ncbi:MAG: DUF4349 domain-containing protein, partial [Lachnospiraceae bacterium]|nr:DUF4349 domain-containing protein [Lachnospiraceae bacterium]
YRNTRSASLTIRIPKNKLDGFLNTISEISNVISRGENVEDVTLTYSDLESHKAVLQAEHARLMEFLEQAETIEDMLTIESRLSDIQYQLESMESQLRTYDNKVDYSTLYLQVNEVEELTPVEEEPELTTWQRISKGFMNNLNGILNGLKEIGIWFLIHIPTFVLLGVITLIIIQFILKITKKSKKKELAVYTQQQNMTAPQQQNMTAPQQEKKNNGK